MTGAASLVQEENRQRTRQNKKAKVINGFEAVNRQDHAAI